MKSFEMTQEELDAMYEISKSGKGVMKFGNYWSGMDTQERANSFWKTLGEKYLFDYSTVSPNGKGHRFFDAMEIVKI